MELPDVPQIARELAGAEGTRREARRPRRVSSARWRPWTATSCARSASAISHRRACIARSRAPFFIDKMPNNCLYVGLIHLILPNAKIIDARRHPLGCCFSAFKQHFARGQSFYLRPRGSRPLLPRLRGSDGALRSGAAGPGPSGASTSRMIEDTEAEVRRLLDYCGLPFEEALPAFLRERAPGAHRELRAGAPADFPGGDRPLAAFRAMARAACKQALGPVLTHYPAVPGLHQSMQRRADQLKSVANVDKLKQ